MRVPGRQCQNSDNDLRDEHHRLGVPPLPSGSPELNMPMRWCLGSRPRAAAIASALAVRDSLGIMRQQVGLQPPLRG
jgi:hypothetical protein